MLELPVAASSKVTGSPGTEDCWYVVVVPPPINLQFAVVLISHTLLNPPFQRIESTAVTFRLIAEPVFTSEALVRNGSAPSDRVPAPLILEYEINGNCPTPSVD